MMKKNSQCLVCGSQKLVKYLDLGQSALANAYLTENNLQEPEFKAPLEVYYCENCHLCQLLHIVDRDVLFRDYAYFSSASPQLVEHFDKYAEEVFNRFPGQAKKMVLDIASNDGILLKAFKARGANVLGIDPAKNVAALAQEQGINTIAEFFNKKAAGQILKDYGQAGIITANNVLAHTDEIHDILDGVKELLDENGVFVIQAKYLADLLEKNEFDTTYHEHIAYFSLLPLVYLLQKHGFEIFDVEHVETEGGSLRVFAGHAPSVFPINKSVGETLNRERKMGLDRAQTFLDFAGKPAMVKEKILEILTGLKKQGKKIAGYGASAKGNTFLQYCGINPDILDYIVDNTPYKQGKYTPGTHIPIVPPAYLKENTPDYILIIAWNFADSIMEREKWFSEKGGRFVVAIPQSQIV